MNSRRNLGSRGGRFRAANDSLVIPRDYLSYAASADLEARYLLVVHRERVSESHRTARKVSGHRACNNGPTRLFGGLGGFNLEVVFADGLRRPFTNGVETTMFRAPFHTMSVATYPGQIAFTVTPLPLTSAASARVRPTSACLDAV